VNYRNKTVVLILVATLVRCITAFCLELGNDEVYYRMYAQHLQWNYFDHPPMVGWMIRLTTANLLFDNEFFIRLGAIISAAITTWFIFLSGKKLNNAYTGYLAAAIYTATIYGSIVAGTFILPDSPQMIFWAAGLYLLIDIAHYTTINRVKKRKLLLFGIIAGLGMLCKIHTTFLWAGLLLYLLLNNRQWFKEPVLYLSAITTLLIFYPVIKWNIDNHFVTYLYHGQRVNVTGSGFNFSGFLSFAGGQVLYCNPVIFFLLIPATIAAIKNELPVLSSQKGMLLLCSLPLLIIATIISFFKPVLPHWTGPAYSGLVLLTACYLNKRKRTSLFERRIMPKPLLVANTFLFVLISSGILLINFMPGTAGSKANPHLGDGDFTLDMYGWKKFKKAFKKMIESDLQTGLVKSNACIISNKWFPAAHLDYYAALPLKKDLLALGDTNDIHQYAWINTERRLLLPGDDAYYIAPSNNYADAKELYGNRFTTILPPQVIEQERGGRICRRFYVWRLKNFRP